MFVLLDNKLVSDSNISQIIEKLANPYNDTDNLFEVNRVQVGDYTLATNGTIYDSNPDLKMVCKSKSKSDCKSIYDELCKYSDFGNNIEKIKSVVYNKPFCLIAINNNGDYLVRGDSSGMEGLYCGSSKDTIVMYSTYHINTYFKSFVDVDNVTPVETNECFTLCLNGTTQTIKMFPHFNDDPILPNGSRETIKKGKQISIAGQIGLGIMSGDLLNGCENNMGMDSIFGPLVSDSASNIEYETHPNKYGVSIFDRIVQWEKIQKLFDTVSVPKSTNVFYDKNFFKNYKSNE
jgi:hypothetical protein